MLVTFSPQHCCIVHSERVVWTLPDTATFLVRTLNNLELLLLCLRGWLGGGDESAKFKCQNNVNQVIQMLRTVS